MAISFDTDPLGSILEYGHLHRTKDAQGRHAWETANIKGLVGQSPWLGYCIHEHQLVEALGAGRGHAPVQPVVRRVLTELRTKHLIEPYTQDSNQATEWLEITALGSELVQADSHREYVHGMKYVVKRWRSSVFMIYPKNSDANIGTGFLIRSDRVATARHIPDQLIDFEIATEDGTVLPHRHVLVLPGKDIDVAVIELAQPASGIQPMRLTEEVGVLDDLVVMGYPPVAKTDGPYLLANKGEITATVKRYDKNAADLLISSLLRGGYSGGPAVNHRGNVVGVMAENLYRQIEESSQDRNAALGIAAATRVCYLKDILAGKGEEWQPGAK
jgi:S1-C subfamily serine protease